MEKIKIPINKWLKQLLALNLELSRLDILRSMGREAPRCPPGPTFAAATAPWAHLGEVHQWGGHDSSWGTRRLGLWL